ncbi:MAG: hypothetical protein AAGF15_08260 [Pseudomonadota bacterium]
MAVTVTRSPNAYKIQVQAHPPGGAPPQTLNLDMSLQRHAYRNLEQAAAKPQNSILHNAVTDAEIERDLAEVGQQVEAKLKGQGQPMNSFAPTLAQQLAGVRQGMDAGAGVGGSIQSMETNVQQTAFGDYRVASGRTYRVDNPSINVMAAANHCYPIAGPGLWANVDQSAFAGAVMFRRLEVALSGKGKPFEVWEKLARDPGGKFNPLHGTFTGAATEFGRLPNMMRQKIVEVAGNTRFHQEIENCLGRLEAQRH